MAKNFALKAGIQPGFMVNKDDVRHVNTFDFAIPVGMSYEFDNFVIDGRYNIGVTKVPKHGDGYTNVVQLTSATSLSCSPQEAQSFRHRVCRTAEGLGLFPFLFSFLFPYLLAFSRLFSFLSLLFLSCFFGAHHLFFPSALVLDFFSYLCPS